MILNRHLIKGNLLRKTNVKSLLAHFLYPCHHILYINDSSKWPIQILLRQIVIVSSGMQAESSAVDVIPPAQTVKMAVIVIATVPMLIAYPFVQKYFVKVALVGSVKG